MLKEETSVKELNKEDINKEVVKESKELVSKEIQNVLTLPVEEATTQILQDIINAPDKDSLQHQFDLFNITQSKKNAMRVVKLEGLMDKVEDQMIKRFCERPDQVSNRELMDYVQIISSQIERSQKCVDSLAEKPLIKINNQKNEVNVNVGPALDKASQVKVAEAVRELIKNAAQNRPKEINEELITPEQDNSSEIKILNAEEVEIKEGENNE